MPARCPSPLPPDADPARGARAKIFSAKTPHSFGTFLVDGQVAGTWRHEGGRIVRTEFHPLSRRVRVELDAEAEGLAELHR